MREPDQRARRALDALPIAVAECSSDGRIVYANPALERLLGGAARGHRIHAYLVAGSAQPTDVTTGEARATHTLASPLGSIPVRQRVAALAPGDADATQVVVIDDMRPVEELVCTLERDATTDALTGLANRRALDAQLAAETDRVARYDRPLSVLVIDVDQFKRINDVWGHPAGDRALRAVAEVLRASLRATDFVARLGGDEFVAILPETGPEGAATTAERIAARVREQVPSGARASLSVTIGAASAERGDTAEMLLARADAALIEAKRLLHASLTDTGDFDRAPTTGDVSRVTPRRGW